MPKKDDSRKLFLPYKENEKIIFIPKEKKKYPLCEQGLPVPPEEYWLGYGSNGIEEYLGDGKYDVEIMMKILKDSGFELTKGNKMLDLGCGGGRMIRWFLPYADKCELWGTDINSELIYWLNKYLNPPFNFATTTTVPHLPFADSYFDLIYCGSVFTHIDDLAVSWLLETRRILDPDGRLFITIHDQNTVTELETNPIFTELWLSKHMSENKIFQDNKTKYDIFINDRGPDSQIFYDIDYFCSSVKSFFEVLSVTPGAYGYQTGILLKKK